MPKGVYPHTHIKKKTYDPDLVEKVRHHYEVLQMTKVEVSLALGIGRHVVERIMIRHNIKARPAIKRNQRGENNTSWKGDNATYSAFHYRVYSSKQKTGICTVCSERNQTEWANISGDYKNIDDYQEMCRSCHRQHDMKWWLSNGRLMSSDVPRTKREIS